MISYLKAAITGLFTTSVLFLSAQCTDCTIDQTCSSPDGFPTVCPATLPEAVVGTFYEQFLTFFMPPTITDPGSGTVLDLISIEVTSISGLPFGTTYTLGDDDGIFYPGQGQTLGCATICGTPLLPGVFDMLITVNATVSVSGFQFEQAQSFSYTITVVPGEGNSGSFVYSTPADCGSLSSTLSATVAAPSPAVTSYLWTLPNGDSFTDSTIQVNFNGAGDYLVSLQTTISNYQLNSIQLTGVGNGWGGDEDFLGSPDPYITIADSAGNTVYTSSAIDNSNTANWTGIDLPLSNPPYIISFFDDDPISPDDLLGSQTIELNTGINSFSANGNNGFVQIALVPLTQLEDSVVLRVFATPEITVTQNGNTLSASPNDLLQYTWYLNGIAQSQTTGASLSNAQPGLYYCEGITAEGCVGSSNEVLVCPTMNITFDIAQQVLNASAQFDSYQWYFNGVMVTGATLPYLIDPAPGVYTVQGTTSTGCNQTSNPFDVTSVNEVTTVQPVLFFPNPTTNIVNFHWNGEPLLIRIYNAQGSLVWEENKTAINGNISLATEKLSGGLYFVRGSWETGELQGSFFKQ
jgi:hypothetical protein